MENARAPGYWSVIPATVRYDKALRPNAKLLYGEISALTVAEGYCWAENGYFAELFGLSKKTVGELIAQLAKRGHIRLEVERDADQAVVCRKIWIVNRPSVDLPPPPKNRGRSPENPGDPPPKNPEDNNTSKSNTPHKPPKGGRGGELPQEARDKLNAYVTGRPALAEALRRYLDNRRALKKAVRTEATVDLILRKLDKLSGGDDRVKIAILEQSVERSWTGLFALEEGQARGQPPEASGDEEDGIHAI